jgi:hypothetical protein
MKLKLPSWASTIGGLVTGILAVLNQTTFSFASPWQVYITIALFFLSGIGFSPLVGPAFRAALHLSAKASLIISSGLGAAALAATTLTISSGAKGVILGALTFLAAIGFAPTVPVPVPAPTPAPTPAAPATPASGS